MPGPVDAGDCVACTVHTLQQAFRNCCRHIFIALDDLYPFISVCNPLCSDAIDQTGTLAEYQILKRSNESLLAQTRALGDAYVTQDVPQRSYHATDPFTFGVQLLSASGSDCVASMTSEDTGFETFLPPSLPRAPCVLVCALEPAPRQRPGELLGLEQMESGLPGSDRVCQNVAAAARRSSGPHLNTANHASRTILEKFGLKQFFYANCFSNPFVTLSWGVTNTLETRSPKLNIFPVVGW